MTRVKVCGITNHEDAQKAAYYGAWAAGFIFVKKSPRYISPSRARKIIESLPPFITPVGVFANLSERAVRDICGFTGIRTLQFHGEEKPDYCKRFKGCKIIKAFRIGSIVPWDLIKKYKVDAYLFDTYDEAQLGGTGKPFQWNALNSVKLEKPYILAGGLDLGNIDEALKTVTPYAVDISSGLEKSPGIKDPRKIREFFRHIQSKNS